MTNVWVLYYSSYGHVERMARAVAAGARELSDAEVEIKRVPELVPEDLAKKSGYKLDQDAPVAKPDELANYDAIIFGTPTRFGNMCAQMRMNEIMGGSPYGAATIAGPDGSRKPTETELQLARFQGHHVTELAGRTGSRQARLLALGACALRANRGRCGRQQQPRLMREKGRRVGPRLCPMFLKAEPKA